MKKVFTIILLFAATLFGTIVLAEEREPLQLNPAETIDSSNPALAQAVGVGIVRGRRRARRVRRRRRRRMRRRMMRRNRLRLRGGIGVTRGRM